MDGRSLYVTVSAAGYLGSAPVTAVRRINLVTGAERVIRPAHGSFAGTFSAAFDGMLLFAGSADLSAYRATTGQLVWRRAGVVPQSEDVTRQTLYVTSGNGLTGLDPRHRGTDQKVGGPGVIRPVRRQGRCGARPGPGGAGRCVGVRRRASAGGMDHAACAVAALLRRPLRPGRQRRPRDRHRAAGGVRPARRPRGRRSRTGVPAARTRGDQQLTRGRPPGPAAVG